MRKSTCRISLAAVVTLASAALVGCGTKPVDNPDGGATVLTACASPNADECQLKVHVTRCDLSAGITVTPNHVGVPKPTSGSGPNNPRLMVWKIQDKGFEFANDGISNIRVRSSGAQPRPGEFVNQPNSSPDEFRILNNNSSTTEYKYDVKVVDVSGGSSVACITLDPFIKNQN